MAFDPLGDFIGGLGGGSSLITGGCVNDVAYIASATAQGAAIKTDALRQTAIQLALLTWQRYTQGKFSDMRRDLADRRMRMSEALLAQAAKTWGEEAAFVSAQMGQTAPVVQYGLAVAVEDTVEEAWRGADAGFDAAMRRMGLGHVTPCEDHRMGRGMAMVKTDLYSHMLRAAEARHIALGDRRYGRQLTAIALSKGVLSSASSMGALSAGQEQVRGALLGTINTAVAMWGYQDTRWQRAPRWSRTPNAESAT